MVEGVFSPAEEAGSDLEAQDRRASFALPGLLLAGGALLCAILTLFVLLGLTPIAPTTPVVIASAVLNGIFVVGLLYLIGRELSRLLRARATGDGRPRVFTSVSLRFSRSWQSRLRCLWHCSRASR
jgi:two-component system nitrogen regulation sensor histidine kinase NtrY